MTQKRAKISTRNKQISVRADDQLPLKFAPEEKWADAVDLSTGAGFASNHEDYFKKGYHLDPDLDQLTFNLLSRLVHPVSIGVYEKLVYARYLADKKFHNINLKAMQVMLDKDPVEFLRDDLRTFAQITPNTAERNQIVNLALKKLIDNDNIEGFFSVVEDGGWALRSAGIELNKNLIDAAREKAFDIATGDNPKEYFDRWLEMYSEILYDITEDAADNLAANDPEEYYKLLDKRWDQFQMYSRAFEIMCRRISKSDPKFFFEGIFENREEYADAEGGGLQIPKDAILEAGKAIAKENPEFYVEMGLDTIPELLEVSREIGLSGRALPEELYNNGIRLYTDYAKDNFVSISESQYQDEQRHPKAVGKRYDFTLNLPLGSEFSGLYIKIADDYQERLHSIGANETKSFALISFDTSKKDVLVEQIQSDFHGILAELRDNDKYTDSIKAKFGTEKYNEFVRKMTEHLAAYPYLMIQRLAEFVDQNNEIDTIKLSTLSAVQSLTGVLGAGEKISGKGKRIYETVPKELGFDMNEYSPPFLMQRFIDSSLKPINAGEEFSESVKVNKANTSELADYFRQKWAPGYEAILHIAAERLSKEDFSVYVDLELYRVKEFWPYTKKLLEGDDFRLWAYWNTYDGDMKELAKKAEAGAKKAVERLYEQRPKKEKSVSKRDKGPRYLDVKRLRPDIEDVIGSASNFLDFSGDVKSFMKSINDAANAKLISRRQQKQISGMISRYIKAFLDELFVKVAQMYGENSEMKKLAKPKSTKAGVFIVLPEDIAKQFPLLGEHDTSDPHVTALFIGEVPNKQEELLVKTIKEIAANHEPFVAKLADKVSYFPPTKHSDGCKIAKMEIVSDGIHSLHKDLKKAISDAGIKIDDHFPKYKPHVTLSYMEPPRKTYDRIIPSGSWVVEEIHIWNGDSKKKIRLGNSKKAECVIILSKRAKVTSDKPAYKEKKKTDTGYVWVYDEKHVKKRWKEKKDKLKKLEKDIKKVREQYKKDLKSDDDRTRAIAAIVGIMDETAMRIGNEESAKEGTFGASTLKVKHVKGGSGKMTFDFPGKGAIEQNVVLENNEVIKVIRDLMKGKKKDDFIFEVDGKKIWDRAVNRYLKPLGISAKDLRGFHSNRLMKETLKKKDWKDALKEVSEIVGHEAATLKNQYLDPELVEKHEDKKKEASLSIRAQKAEVNPEKNIHNVVGDISNYPDLQKAWTILAPFLPDGATLTSGWRGDEDQARIIIEYWLSAVWPGGREQWKHNNGFFYTNFSGPSSDALRWWLGQVKSGKPLSTTRYKQLVRDIEPLRIIMTSYKPRGLNGEPPAPLQIAKLGTSDHLRGTAMDISGASLGKIMRALQYVSNTFSANIVFSDIRREKGQNAVHVSVMPGVTLPNYQKFYNILEEYEATTKRASLSQQDSKFVDYLENKYFGKPISVTRTKIDSKENWKEHYEKGTGGWAKKDKVFSAGDNTLGIRPGVKVTEEIVSAWVLLRPHLPSGAVMTSGVRTPIDQTRIINNYWKKSRLNEKHPDVEDPYEKSKILIQNGYIVGPPTREDRGPVHGSGKTFDVSGPKHILREIERAAKKVSDDPSIPVSFSQVLLERKNNAVHIGVKETLTLSELKRKSATLVVNKKAELKMTDIKEQVTSIYDDLLRSNPPKDVVEEYEKSFGHILEKTAELIREDEARWYGTDYADDEPNKYEREKDDPKWNEVLIDKDGKKLTRKQIRDHYVKNRSKIMAEVKDKPAMIFLGTGKNKNILKRNHNNKKIVITNDDKSKSGSPDNYFYWIDRRTTSIHRVFGPKTTLGFVDLDVHGDFPKAKVLEYAKKVASEIKSKYGSTATIYDSGGTGYHIEFKVKETNSDTLRNELREMCEDLNEGFDGFTTGIVKGSGVRTDTTTLKNNGNIRVPGALHEVYGGEKKVTSKKASVISKRSELTLEEIRDEMGRGIDDEPGDWFEKSPIFVHREEVPEYGIDADRRKAISLSENDPEKFFYRGLHKKYPDIEAKALKNMLKDNAKFYFVFKYNEREESEFSNLMQEAAEMLSQQDARAFFYYHLHDKFPELGRGAIVQLIDNNPDSFFDLGLEKDYPDFTEAAGNARNIKDPHKVELERPEWINDEADKPISLRDRNAKENQIHTKLSKKAESLGPISPMKLKKISDPQKLLEDFDDSDLLLQHKFDGWKTQAVKDSKGAVKLYTRRGDSFEANVPSLIEELEKKLDSGDFVLGELTFEKDGKQSISDVQTIAGSNPETAQEHLKKTKGHLVFQAYDLLWNNGHNITKTPYIERYNKLKKQIGKSSIIKVPKNYAWSELDEAMKNAEKEGSEGIIVKTKNSTYNYGPKGANEKTGDWFKYKIKGKKAQTDEVILNKYDKKEKKLVFPAYQYKDGKLFEVGKLSGLPQEEEAEVKKQIDDGKIVVVEVTYQEVMSSGKLRHMGWSRRRTDKPAKEVKVSG